MKVGDSAAAGFRRIAALRTHYGSRVAAFVSPRTGLRAILLDPGTASADMVHGYFALATRDPDDRRGYGLPHTLEHLVFLGSKNYPYKGVLDTLANLSLAQGTNAWTATDHTCYTLSTAGTEGFCNLLPVYLDHLLSPTLRDSGFVTEIYNINQRGEDGGVVFSEMQGVENDEQTIAHKATLEALYPAPCAYSAETGGVMECIRKLSIEMIRKYHGECYRPDNLCVIVVGKVDEEHVLKTLSAFDASISVEKYVSKDKSRPWFEYPVPPFTKSVNIEAEFPEEDESIGSVQISYRGPEIHHVREIGIVQALLEYLVDSSVSPLSQVFVECQEPLCSAVDYETNEFKVTSHGITFEAVAVENLDRIASIYDKTLRSHKICMTRMHALLRRGKIQFLQNLENDPADTLACGAISNFLYGEYNESALRQSFDALEVSDSLLCISEDEWQSALSKYFIECPRVVVQMKPSEARAEAIQNERDKMIAEREKSLGQKGLADAQRAIDEAIRENAIPVPNNVLASFPVPTGRVKPAVLKTAALPPLAAEYNSDPQLQAKLLPYSRAIPYPIRLDSVTSSIFEVTFIWNCSNLTKEQMAYLEILQEIIFGTDSKCPRSESMTPYTELVNQLNAVTTSYDCSLGLDSGDFMAGRYDSAFLVSAQTYESAYTCAVKLLIQAQLHHIVSMERLETIVENKLADLRTSKRQGDSVCAWVARTMLYTDSAVRNHAGVIAQELFLKGLKKRIQRKDQSLLRELEKLKRAVFSRENLSVCLSADFESLFTTLGVDGVLLPWTTLFDVPAATAGDQQIVESRWPEFTPGNALRTELGRQPTSETGNSRLVRVPAIEDGYLLAVASGPTSRDDKDFAPLVLAVEYLTRLEGALWRQIRGPGLAYGYDVNVNPESGHVLFSIYRSSKLAEAFRLSREAVATAIAALRASDGDAKLGLRSAQNSLICALVKRLDAPQYVASARRYSAVFERIPYDTEVRFAANIMNVDTAAAAEMIERYILPLFEPSTAFVVASTSPAITKGTIKDFAAAGFTLGQISI